MNPANAAAASPDWSAEAPLQHGPVTRDGLIVFVYWKRSLCLVVRMAPPWPTTQAAALPGRAAA